MIFRVLGSGKRESHRIAIANPQDSSRLSTVLSRDRDTLDALGFRGKQHAKPPITSKIM
jgi:hypothetical protein